MVKHAEGDWVGRRGGGGGSDIYFCAGIRGANFVF